MVGKCKNLSSLTDRWRLAKILVISVWILLFSACSGDNDGTNKTDTNNNNAGGQQVTAPNFEATVGKSLYLSAQEVGPPDMQSNSVLSITVEWSIIKPQFDPNLPPPAVIINPHSTAPTFIAYVAGEYVLHMVVSWSDSGEIIAERDVTITVGLDDVQTAKPENHLASSDYCFECHSHDAWLPAIVVHTQVLGTCSSCHDNVRARGKGPNHIITSLQCDTCHVTSAWVPPASFPQGHATFTENCATCHDGVTASGKGPTHLLTSSACQDCHSTTVWIPAVIVNHTQVIGSCESCHNGVLATGKSATHVVIDMSCDFCHGTSSWLGVTQPCPDVTPCPAPDPNTGGSSGNGDPNAGTPGIMPPNHSGFLLGECVTCHNGIDASGKTAAHLATTNLCGACHQPYPAQWRPLPANAVDHSQVIGTCASCHNGINARGKSPTHVATTSECDSCHVTSAWIMVGPPPHVGYSATDCVNCHDGVNASGKSAIHIPTSEMCGFCHESFPANWVPVPSAAVDHSQVIGTCSSCHNAVIATGKSVTHVATTLECDVCHTTAAWLPAPPP